MHARVLFLFGGLKLGLSAPLYVVLCVKSVGIKLNISKALFHEKKLCEDTFKKSDEMTRRRDDIERTAA